MWCVNWRGGEKNWGGGRQRAGLQQELVRRGCAVRGEGCSQRKQRTVGMGYGKKMASVSTRAGVRTAGFKGLVVLSGRRSSLARPSPGQAAPQLFPFPRPHRSPVKSCHPLPLPVRPLQPYCTNLAPTPSVLVYCNLEHCLSPLVGVTLYFWGGGWLPIRLLPVTRNRVDSAGTCDVHRVHCLPFRYTRITGQLHRLRCEPTWDAGGTWPASRTDFACHASTCTDRIRSE